MACSDGRGYLPHWLSVCARDKLHGFAAPAGRENATRGSDGFWECAGGSLRSCSRGWKKQKCHKSIVLGVNRPQTEGVSHLAPRRDCEPYNVFFSSKDTPRQQRRACTAEKKAIVSVKMFKMLHLGPACRDLLIPGRHIHHWYSCQRY